MESTTLVVRQLKDWDTAERIRRLLDGEQGVARVLVRPDRGEVYVKHSRARAPRHRLLERLEGEGYEARLKGST